LSFLEALDVKKFYGVGKVTQTKMYAMGIYTGKELKTKSVEFLTEHFGKSGTHYYHIVRGIHNSPVTPKRIRKSLGAERTFNKNIASEIYMIARLENIAEELQKRLQRNQGCWIVIGNSQSVTLSRNHEKLRSSLGDIAFEPEYRKSRKEKRGGVGAAAI